MKVFIINYIIRLLVKWNIIGFSYDFNLVNIIDISLVEIMKLYLLFCYRVLFADIWIMFIRMLNVLHSHRFYI